MQPDFDRTYEENFSRVYRFLALRAPTRADAEELTQVTFERALRAWNDFDPRRAKVSTWLLAIATNVVIDHRRRLVARPRERPLEDPTDIEEVVEDERGAPGVTAELADALATLKERERVVIGLRFGGDLTGPEIASMLGLSVSNVQQILSRSLRKLRAVLEADSGGPPVEQQAPPVPES